MLFANQHAPSTAHPSLAVCQDNIAQSPVQDPLQIKASTDVILVLLVMGSMWSPVVQTLSHG